MHVVVHRKVVRIDVLVDHHIPFSGNILLEVVCVPDVIFSRIHVGVVRGLRKAHACDYYACYA